MVSVRLGRIKSQPSTVYSGIEGSSSLQETQWVGRRLSSSNALSGIAKSLLRYTSTFKNIFQDQGWTYLHAGNTTASTVGETRSNHMSQFESDPEFYKGRYANQWERHAKNVRALREQLGQRFPVLEQSIRTGLGAESEDLVRIPPHQKGEPDLEVYHDYELLCHIEVSGSNSRRVKIPPQPIYIRPDKLKLAKEKEDAGEPYFFWMVYWDITWLVRATDAWPYRDEVVTKNWYDAQESYCEIPAHEAHPSDVLFRWIARELSKS